MLAYLTSASFAIMMAAFVMVLVSGTVAFFLQWRRINEAYKHPLLQVRDFKQFPFSLQAAIYLDYFFRLAFPSVRKGMVGHANEMLKHVNPRKLDFQVRWPIAGLYGGCLIGLVAMICFWILLALQGV